MKPSFSSKFKMRAAGFFIQQIDFARINHVERDADGDGLAVRDLKTGKLFQFVRGPMAEIERARGTCLERITARGDVVEMQFGTAMN